MTIGDRIKEARAADASAEEVSAVCGIPLCKLVDFWQ